uniref:Uncharacterized protein n=1 Tax=Kalanchoe fedtschenkoi TaxID=63787 RepID=A0A7N0UQP9_KALFE
MVASIGVRTALMRSLCRRTSTTTATPSTATSAFPPRVPSSAPSVRSGSGLRRSPASASSRFLRRELSSLLPLHSAVASARLVSKLPDDAVSFEGRFVNYLSPI